MTTLAQQDFQQFLELYFNLGVEQTDKAIHSLETNTKMKGYNKYIAGSTVNIILQYLFNTNSGRFDALNNPPAIASDNENYEILSQFAKHPLDKNALDQIKDINQMLKILYKAVYIPSKEDMILFRGANLQWSRVKPSDAVDGNYVSGYVGNLTPGSPIKLKPGDIIQDPYFLSTSTNKSVAYKFACATNRIGVPTVLVIRLKKGVSYRALSLGDFCINGEREVLLPPMTELEVKIVKLLDIDEVNNIKDLGRDCRVRPNVKHVMFVICEALPFSSELYIDVGKCTSPSCLSFFRGGDGDSCSRDFTNAVPKPIALDSVQDNMNFVDQIVAMPNANAVASGGSSEYITYKGRRYRIRVDTQDKRKRFIQTKHGALPIAVVRKEQNKTKR